MNAQILSAEHLKKSFGKVDVLQDINLMISKGEIYGLVGQNGAGKTTLLRLVAGLMKPAGGSVRVHTQKGFVGCDQSGVSELIKTLAAAGVSISVLARSSKSALIWSLAAGTFLMPRFFMIIVERLGSIFHWSHVMKDTVSCSP